MKVPKKLLFMHIPKTAGSSLNSYLESQFPLSESALHIENQVLGVPKDHLPTFKGKKFLSAHLKYDTLKDVLEIEQYFKMTMLRDPARQTLSHLGWMNRLGYPENNKELEKYPDYIKHIVERMHTMDIVAYLDTMNEHERNFFDNCQTRYFLPVYGDIPLSDRLMRQALSNLSEFNLIGLVEKFEESLLLLAYFMNWQPPKQTPRKNPSDKKYFLNLETADDEIKNRFNRLIYYDQILYDEAQQIFGNQQKEVFQQLKNLYPNLDWASDYDQHAWQELSELQMARGIRKSHKLTAHKILRKMKGIFSLLHSIFL